MLSHIHLRIGQLAQHSLTGTFSCLFGAHIEPLNTVLCQYVVGLYCSVCTRHLLYCPTPDSIGAIPYLYPRAAVLLFVSWYYPVVFVIAQYVDFGDALAGNCTGSGRANPWTAATLEHKIDFQICI